jgi:hypothetical protein
MPPNNVNDGEITMQCDEKLQNGSTISVCRKFTFLTTLTGGIQTCSVNVSIEYDNVMDCVPRWQKYDCIFKHFQRAFGKLYTTLVLLTLSEKKVCNFLHAQQLF